MFFGWLVCAKCAEEGKNKTLRRLGEVLRLPMVAQDSHHRRILDFQRTKATGRPLPNTKIYYIITCQVDCVRNRLGKRPVCPQVPQVPRFPVPRLPSPGSPQVPQVPPRFPAESGNVPSGFVPGFPEFHALCLAVPSGNSPLRARSEQRMASPKVSANTVTTSVFLWSAGMLTAVNMAAAKAAA